MYRVVIYPEAAEQIAELPPHLLGDYAQALDAAAAVPWDGAPQHRDNPAVEVRRWLSGRSAWDSCSTWCWSASEIHVLQLLWLELPDD